MTIDSHVLFSLYAFTTWIHFLSFFHIDCFTARLFYYLVVCLILPVIVDIWQVWIYFMLLLVNLIFLYVSLSCIFFRFTILYLISSHPPHFFFFQTIFDVFLTVSSHDIFYLSGKWSILSIGLVFHAPFVFFRFYFRCSPCLQI